MELTWDLNRVYPSFESEQFQQDRVRAERLAGELNRWSALQMNNGQAAAGVMEEFLRQYNAYQHIYLRLFSYAELRFSADSGNVEAVNLMDELEEAGYGAGEALVSFSKWLGRVSADELDRSIRSSSYLEQHGFYLRGLRSQSQHLLSEEGEAVLARMQATGSKAWERLYMRTLSTLRADVELDGVTRSYTLAELRNLVYDPDPAVRQAAAEAEQEACRSVAEQSAACINAVSGEAAAVYGLRGYASPLHKVLDASRMDQETLDVMLQAIRESLPVFQRYYARKAERLGYAAGQLPFWDVFAPVGAAESSMGRIPYAEAQAMIIAGFSRFSPALGGFARKVFEQRWIDAEPRSGKGNFGMCVDIVPIGESRIITSFQGYYMDVSVLAHEIGHAYHSSRLAGHTMVNMDYPVPIAETASIFCESLMTYELLMSLPAEEADTMLERSLSDAGYYIVDFYARYCFESGLYACRSSGPLSVEELNDLMLESMVAAYGESILPGSVHPYQWISKAGYYMAGNEFLNFPYSFGLLFSKGLYAQYKKQGKVFVNRYEQFLSATSTRSIADAAKLMDIDVHSLAFWQEALGFIAGDVDKFTGRG
ncbi:M3 family oligoendopeptidase [Paenibacillus tritici]|uniref:M3 family oligoendopeptidase n=1 Tax=Paenibacillus tritici TaxID=1873425 RepID=A0ABX2DST9_9BACL|nr:M3 family oligoendopeptidase [Paenibacillus tritici]NQX46634.1 M3 family oligoendopeptidase [Paenibacillus tritici]